MTTPPRSRSLAAIAFLFLLALAVVVVVGLVVLRPATNVPIHKDAASVPSKADGPAAARYAEPVEHARQRARALVAGDNLPGLSVAIAVNGEIAWAEAFGLADVDDRTPLTPHTRFRLGALSKPLTAVAAARLRDQGRLDLDAPVQRYVPAYPAKAWPITARQLMGDVAGVHRIRGDNKTIGAMNGSLGQRNRRYRTLTSRFAGESPPVTAQMTGPTATFDLSGISAPGDAYVPTTWPPEPPKEGDLVIYGGVPGTPRHVNVETEQAHFIFDTITGLVTSVGFDSIMVRVNYGKLLDADNLDGEIVSTVGPGTSGGPVYRIDESGEPFNLELVGLIAEADNVLLARHAKLIRVDGTIDR